MMSVTEDREFAENNIETWEINTDSTVWLFVRDKRDASGYKKQRVGGRQGGSKRIRLSTDDRRYNQEQIVDEMRNHDPFTSGLLRLVDEVRQDDIVSTYHLTDTDLEVYLEIKDVDLFTEQADEIRSELVLRRLHNVAMKVGTVSQVEALQTLIDDRYTHAKSQPSTLDDSKGIRLTPSS